MTTPDTTPTPTPETVEAPNPDGTEATVATAVMEDPRERERRRRKALLVLFLASLSAANGVWVLAGILVSLLLPLFFLARLAARRAGIALLPGGVAVRTGAWTRIVRAARHARVQAVSLVESPFDRRARMATLVVDTAVAGRGAHRIRLPYLEEEEAYALHARLSSEAGETAFVW